MDYNSTNYVQRILDEGSISDAAMSLGISQPALSAKIKKIESEYGITIFHKGKRPATITEEGRRYLEYTNRQINLDNAFRRYISDSRELHTGDIRIGGTNLYTQCIIPEAVKNFNQKYPGVNIKVINASVPTLTSMLSKGEVDVFISSSGKNSQGVIYEPLIPTKLLLCVPSSLNIDTPVTKEEKSRINPSIIINTLHDLRSFEGLPFIMLDESQLMGRVMRDILRRYSIGSRNLLFTDQALTAYAMTKSGLGISLMFDRIVEMIHSDEKVEYYTLADPEMLGEIRVAYAEQEYTPLVIKEFIRYLRESISDA